MRYDDTGAGAVLVAALAEPPVDPEGAAAMTGRVLTCHDCDHTREQHDPLGCDVQGCTCGGFDDCGGCPTAPARVQSP